MSEVGASEQSNGGDNPLVLQHNFTLDEGGEERLHGLLKLLPVAVYTTDAAGRITFFNESAAALWGRRPTLNVETWCGSWRMYWPDGTALPHDQCPMAMVLTEGLAVPVQEAVLERPDGTRLPFMAFPSPLRDATGKVVGAVNMFVDITDRKRNEEISQRLAAIVESSDDAIISKTLDGMITSWNNGAARIFGYAAEEIIGKPVRTLIPPDRQDEEDAIIERISRGERIEHYETVRVRKDGKSIDIALTVSPIRNAQGKIVGASKIARDISERKRAEEAARRVEEEFRDFVENASVGMHWVGADGIILWANRTEMEMLGFTREEYIGHHIAEFHMDQPVIEDILQRLTERETIHNCEARMRCKDGSTRHVLINSNVLWDGDKFVHTRCFTRDITERKLSEEHVAVLAREAEHRTKNILATVQATVRLSQSDTPKGLKQAIEGRIQALAKVHTLFVQSGWKGAELHSLVTQELLPYCQDGNTRVQSDGPNVLLEPQMAQTIAMILHELATNAAKYGALSTAKGHVKVGWSLSLDGRFFLRWTEMGGPPVKPPERQGFGTRVMEVMIRGQLKGEARFDWRAEGLACEIVLPAQRI